MKALLCRQFGAIDDLVVEDVASPAAGPGQVVVAVSAAGVNFPDTLIVQGKYQIRPAFPFSPGGEFSGVVKEVGAGVANVSAGDAVVGVALYGAFAEEVLVDAAAVIPIVPGVDRTLAAALLFAHGTSLHALKDRARLQRGEVLLVLGAAGGVGLAAVEIGKMLGATVIAAASSEAKLAVCRAHGADHVIDYRRDDLKDAVRKLTGGRGADVVFDPVGGDMTEAALRATAWNGRLLVIGFASGEIPKIPLNLPLLKGASIVGVFWGEFMRREPALNAQNARELMQAVAAGKLKPFVSARYPLARATEALQAFVRREVTGKIVIDLSNVGKAGTTMPESNRDA
jgi:NADPH2:quinone reductase